MLTVPADGGLVPEWFFNFFLLPVPRTESLNSVAEALIN